MSVRERLLLGPLLIALLLALLWLDGFLDQLACPAWLTSLGYPHATLPPGIILFIVMVGLSIMAARELADILHDKERRIEFGQNPNGELTFEKLEVSSPDGKFQGSSKVELIADGRGLLEHWTGNPAVGNSTGKSLNAWNAAKKRWQQFWIGSGGQVLELAGGLDAAGRMILSGEHDSGDTRLLERITWTPNADGSVRQLWEQSTDAGKTWHVEFDGRYLKKPAKVASNGGATYRALYYLLQ